MNTLPPDTLSWTARWSAVYAPNAAIPALGALLLLGDGQGAAAVGLFVGLMLLWAEGVLAGVMFPRVRKAAVIGGVVLLVGHLFPIIQFEAALLGGFVANLLFPGPPGGFALFTAAVVSGQLLIGLALLIGLPFSEQRELPALATTSGEISDIPPNCGTRG